DVAFVSITPDTYSLTTLSEKYSINEVSTVFYRSYVTEYIYFSTIYSTIEITLKPEQPSLTCIAANTFSVSSSTLIESSSSAPVSSANVKMMPSASDTCVCFTQTIWNVSNPSIVDEWVSNITKELLLERHSLSSTIRRKISATDIRKSAGFIGYVGVTVIVITLGTIVLSDICTYLHSRTS
ncbi:hypothetical protein ACJMK2_010342, partial [Sinanodonta woodiana]